jgi:hypothetical protein
MGDRVLGGRERYLREIIEVGTARDKIQKWNFVNSDEHYF